MRANENRKVKPWKHSFFKTQHSSNLDDEVNLVLGRSQLINYLNTILGPDDGLFLGTLKYKDYFRVEVKYGITASTLDSLKLYFMKSAPVTTSFDFIVVTPNSIDELAESFIPKKSLPSSFEFISSLNNSLKRPYKKIDDIRQKRIF